MTAIVKHISVHPKFRRCRVLGIFDDIDRTANLDRHRRNKESARQKVLRNSESLSWGNSPSFQYVKRSPSYYGDTTKIGDVQPWPEGHSLAGISDAELNRMLDSMPDKPTD